MANTMCVNIKYKLYAAATAAVTVTELFIVGAAAIGECNVE